MTVTVYRFFESMGSNSGKHVVTVVADGADARLVFENRIEHPDVPTGLMKRVLARTDGRPTTAQEWARQVAHFYPLTSNHRDEREGTLNDVSLQEHAEFRNFVADGAIQPPRPAQATDTEDMRQTIRMVLEQQGTLHLNPRLQDWLNGGDPPADFDGLVLYPEQAERDAVAEDPWQYRMFFSAPSRELVAVLRVDRAGRRVTEERIDGVWQPLGPGDPDEFSGSLVMDLQPRFLTKFLAFFDDAEARGVTLFERNVSAFYRPPRGS